MRTNERQIETAAERDLVTRLRDMPSIPERRNLLRDEAADEIERLRGLLIHYGDIAGVPEAEMRRVCKL